jgi:predicted permease
MDSFARELRFAFRFLVQRPFFATMAILSLALGIGASTAIFSVVNALVLKAPPGLGDASRVVEIGRTNGGRGFDTFSYPEFEDLRAQTVPLSHVVGWTMAPVSFSLGEVGERRVAFHVSHDYFAAVGVTPYRGRFFAAAEDQVPVGSAVVVLSHRLWRERFDADPAVIGTDVLINRVAFRIIGVTPPEFRGHMAALYPDLFVPLTAIAVTAPGREEFANRNSSWLLALGRLAPTATIEQADAAARTVIERSADPATDPQRIRGARVVPLGPIPGPGRGPATAFLAVLSGLIGIVLLITCANVAGMLIARAVAREREIAIRLALGAERGRLVRQLLLEAVVLFAAGGVAGVALAWWATDLLASVRLPTPMPLDIDVRPDALVLSFGLLLSLATGLVFGVAPALQSTGFSLVSALKSDSTRQGSRGGRTRRIFVGAQVGLSLLLLVSAGLFARALQRAASLDVGFDPTGVQTVAFDLSIDGYNEERGQAIIVSLLERMRGVPGVEAAGIASDLPLDLGESGTVVYIDGYADPSGRPALATAFNRVSDGYLEAIAVPVHAGRTIRPTDRAGGIPVTVVSESLARAAWPGEDAVGKLIYGGSDRSQSWTVIGVVQNTKNQTLMEDVKPMMYLPVAQEYSTGTYMVVRAAPSVSAADITNAIREVDPNLALGPVQSLADINAVGVLPQRLAAAVTAGLGLLALLLSGLGVYGVIAFTMMQRTREVGIRMALGARRSDVIGIVLKSGLRLAIPGLVIGLGLAWAAASVIRSFLLGVPPGDPITFVLMPFVLLVIVLLACVAPARRASVIEPIRALRAD